MKILFIIPVLSILLLSNSDCNKKGSATKYKARLEIKGICMNYTISLLEGDIDSNRIVEEWTDPSTNIRYKNVFGLENPCNFPAALKEKDEFYFVIDSSRQDCMVCEAYYPTPPKKLSIKVVVQ